MSQGNASFVWDGKGTDGTQWPDGAYKMTATARTPTAADVAISTEVQGVVNSVDLTASPPLLSIGGQNYTPDKIKRVVRPLLQHTAARTPPPWPDFSAKSPTDTLTRPLSGAGPKVLTPFSRRFVLKAWA